jgi:hypothetical protein
VTIDLSTLDVPTLQGPGLLPGQLPSNYTIYVRAHVIPDLAFVPLDGTVYTYRTRVAADLPGIGNAAVESTQDVTALPVSACVNGADLRQ